MENNRQNLLGSVIEVSDILKRRHPDLRETAIRTLSEAEAILKKDDLSNNDLLWLEENILTYLCHPKCLYDFCPLERRDGETNQARWQRWGEIVDRMNRQAALLCKDIANRRK